MITCFPMLDLSLKSKRAQPCYTGFELNELGTSTAEKVNLLIII